MGLYNVIDEIARKEITKTETGDNRIFGVVVGMVVKNYHESMPGRVCVSVTTRDKDANELKWARLAMPSSGAKWGHYFLPEIGDQVLLVFEHGNIEKPYVIGCIPKDNNRFLKQAVDSKNKMKKIITKNGNSILFTDEEGEGEKDKIEIITAQTGHRIELNNEKKQILISDKEGKNKILMNTEKGQMEIVAEKKLSIKVGDKIELKMNGESGMTELTTQNFKVGANKGVKLEANDSLAMKGVSMKMEATSSLTMESSGMASLKGAQTKLG